MKSIWERLYYGEIGFAEREIADTVQGKAYRQLLQTQVSLEDELRKQLNDEGKKLLSQYDMLQAQIYEIEKLELFRETFSVATQLISAINTQTEGVFSIPDEQIQANSEF